VESRCEPRSWDSVAFMGSCVVSLDVNPWNAGADCVRPVSAACCSWEPAMVEGGSIGPITGGVVVVVAVDALGVVSITG
jgi:hypothetical protein